MIDVCNLQPLLKNVNIERNRIDIEEKGVQNGERNFI